MADDPKMVQHTWPTAMMDGGVVRHRADHRPSSVRRLWVAPAFNGLGADVWAEGRHRSRLGGDRTLLWENVRYDWAHELVAGWNAVADVLDPPQLDLSGSDS